jgi:putative membrane protein insertion efficiency factor
MKRHVRLFRVIHELAALGLVGLIRIYQVAISPLVGPSCRFEPSCSEYGAQAIRKYGVVSGLFRTLKRIARCHPWHPGGYDPP